MKLVAMGAASTRPEAEKEPVTVIMTVKETTVTETIERLQARDPTLSSISFPPSTSFKEAFQLLSVVKESLSSSSPSASPPSIKSLSIPHSVAGMILSGNDITHAADGFNDTAIINNNVDDNKGRSHFISTLESLAQTNHLEEFTMAFELNKEPMVFCLQRSFQHLFRSSSSLKRFRMEAPVLVTTNESVKCLAAMVGLATNLEEFCLDRLDLENRVNLAPLISALASLPRLRNLHINIWDESTTELASVSPLCMLQLGRSKSLENLHLGRFQLHGTDMEAFRRGLQTNTCIQSIRLNECWIWHLMTPVEREWKAMLQTMLEQYSLRDFRVTLYDGDAIHPSNQAVLERIQWLCRLNRANRGNAICSSVSREEWIQLLALANSDLDVVLSILTKNPSCCQAAATAC